MTPERGSLAAVMPESLPALVRRYAERVAFSWRARLTILGRLGLQVRSGLDTEWIRPPSGGRAPGWQAGLVVAGRQRQSRALPAEA